MSNNDFLVLKNITKAFGKAVVIDNLDLTIKRGTMVTLLGPSGCRVRKSNIRSNFY